MVGCTIVVAMLTHILPRRQFDPREDSAAHCSTVTTGTYVLTVLVAVAIGVHRQRSAAAAPELLFHMPG